MSYAYDGAERLANLLEGRTDGTGSHRLSRYTYQKSGVVSQIAYPSGMTAAFSYDLDLRLRSITNSTWATTLTSDSYTLDSQGNRTAVSEFVQGITAPGGHDNTTLSYDGLSRLTGVSGAVTESFTLDGSSNLATRTGPTATYSYDGADRLTSDGTQSYGWSATDHLTSRGSDTFGYDILGRLTSATVGGTASTFAYNGDGLLQTRTTGATTTRYLWSPGSLARLVATGGGDVVVYGLGPLYLVHPDGTTITLARDGQKSVRAEIADNGTTVNRSFRYAAYGGINASFGGTAPTLLGFAGQLYDPTGLYYLRARWYDPLSARFMTRDPLGLGAPAATQFGYAGGNPIRNTDPTGLLETEVSGDGGQCDETCLAQLAAQQASTSSDETITAQGVQGSVSGALLGGTAYIEFSVVRAKDGTWGATFSPGGGGTTAVVGANASVSVVASNARTLSDYRGQFAEIGAGGGAIITGSATVSQGRTDDGRHVVLVTAGVGVGGKVSFEGVAPVPAYFSGTTNYSFVSQWR